MKVYLQVEYVLDEEEIEDLKNLNLTTKEDIINFISKNMADASCLDEHLQNLIIIGMDI